MFRISDRVKESSSSTGTGAIVLGGAYSGFQTFLNGVGDGKQTYYTIENSSRWEVGIGTYTQATNSLSRDTVLRSSSGQAKIVLEGASVVFCTLPADRAFIKDPSENIGGVSGIFAESGIFSDLTVTDDLTITDALSANSLDITTSISAGSVSSNSLNVNGHTETQSLTVADETLCSGLLTIAIPDNSGCFIHAYRGNLNDETVALHINEDSAPLWKLGVKGTFNRRQNPPVKGFVYGMDGSAGIAANNSNYTEMSSSAGLFTYHDSHFILRASSATGVYIDGKTAAHPVLTVQGAFGQSEDLQRWENSLGVILAKVKNDGSISGALQTHQITFADGTKQTTANRVYNNVTQDFSMSDDSDVVFIDTTSNVVNVHLPTAVGNGGKELMVKFKAGSNSGVLLASGSQTIDGQPHFALKHLYQNTTLISDNSNWFIT